MNFLVDLAKCANTWSTFVTFWPHWHLITFNNSHYYQWLLEFLMSFTVPTTTTTAIYLYCMMRYYSCMCCSVLFCAVLTLRAYLSIWQIFVHVLLYWRDISGLWWWRRLYARLRFREKEKKKMKKESEQKIYECFMGRQLVAIKIC